MTVATIVAQVFLVWLAEEGLLVCTFSALTGLALDAFNWLVAMARAGNG